MPTKKIKTYEEACKKLNLNPAIPSFPNLSAADRKAMQAHYKLVIIAKALNEGWIPDWSDWNQNKYFPWFGFQGSRFVFCNVGYGCTGSFLGSRLCYKDEATAEYAGKTFIYLYNDYYLLNK